MGAVAYLILGDDLVMPLYWHDRELQARTALTPGNR
jgi:hypothetical protein